MRGFYQMMATITVLGLSTQLVWGAGSCPSVWRDLAGHHESILKDKAIRDAIKTRFEDGGKSFVVHQPQDASFSLVASFSKLPDRTIQFKEVLVPTQTFPYSGKTISKQSFVKYSGDFLVVTNEFKIKNPAKRVYFRDEPTVSMIDQPKILDGRVEQIFRTVNIDSRDLRQQESLKMKYGQSSVELDFFSGRPELIQFHQMDRSLLPEIFARGSVDVAELKNTLARKGIPMSGTVLSIDVGFKNKVLNKLTLTTSTGQMIEIPLERTSYIDKHNHEQFDLKIVEDRIVVGRTTTDMTTFEIHSEILPADTFDLK